MFAFHRWRTQQEILCSGMFTTTQIYPERSGEGWISIQAGRNILMPLQRSHVCYFKAHWHQGQLWSAKTCCLSKLCFLYVYGEYPATLENFRRLSGVKCTSERWGGRVQCWNSTVSCYKVSTLEREVGALAYPHRLFNHFLTLFYLVFGELIDIFVSVSSGSSF